MHRAILLLSLALPLAACGSPAVDEENASVEEVAEKVREASSEEGLLRPGKWQTSVSIEEMEMPGMPAEAAEQMKNMMAMSQTSEMCLTPEEAKQPKGDFFGADENCRYDHFRMGGGKIDAAMRCTQGGGTQTMEMDGNYSRDAYAMNMKSRMEGGPAGGPITMRMKVEAKRVGECTRDAA
jgi:hypothetical protein